MPLRLEDTVVDAHHALAVAGLSDLVWGHASIREPDGSGVITKSAGWAFDEITPERLVTVSWGLERIAGTGDVHIEVPIHTQIMAARPDVMCVVHTHSPTVTAFASLAVPLRAISHDGVLFAEDLPRFEETGSLIDSLERGDHLAESLGHSAAILIPQHGMVTVGRSAAEAVMYSVLLERAAGTYLLAAGAGGPAAWSSEAELAEKRRLVWSSKQIHTGYAYLLRVAARRSGSVSSIAPS